MGIFLTVCLLVVATRANPNNDADFRLWDASIVVYHLYN